MDYALFFFFLYSPLLFEFSFVVFVLSFYFKLLLVIPNFPWLVQLSQKKKKKTLLAQSAQPSTRTLVFFFFFLVFLGIFLFPTFTASFHFLPFNRSYGFFLFFFSLF